MDGLVFRLILLTLVMPGDNGSVVELVALDGFQVTERSSEVHDSADEEPDQGYGGFKDPDNHEDKPNGEPSAIAER